MSCVRRLEDADPIDFDFAGGAFLILTAEIGKIRSTLGSYYHVHRAGHIELGKIAIETNEIDNAVANSNLIAEKANATLLASGCGVVGCDSKYLVTLAVSTQGANTQTWVIAAVVTLPAINAATVKLVSIDSLLN